MFTGLFPFVTLSDKFVVLCIAFRFLSLKCFLFPESYDHF